MEQRQAQEEHPTQVELCGECRKTAAQGPKWATKLAGLEAAYEK